MTIVFCDVVAVDVVVDSLGENNVAGMTLGVLGVLVAGGDWVCAVVPEIADNDMLVTVMVLRSVLVTFVVNVGVLTELTDASVPVINSGSDVVVKVAATDDDVEMTVVAEELLRVRVVEVLGAAVTLFSVVVENVSLDDGATVTVPEREAVVRPGMMDVISIEGVPEVKPGEVVCSVVVAGDDAVTNTNVVGVAFVIEFEVVPVARVLDMLASVIVAVILMKLSVVTVATYVTANVVCEWLVERAETDDVEVPCDVTTPEPDKEIVSVVAMADVVPDVVCDAAAPTVALSVVP